MEFINRHRRRLGTFSYNDRAFFSGSSSEIPAAYFLTRPTDFDFMAYKVNVCAIPRSSRPPPDFKGEVLAIEPQGLSAGYVRLRHTDIRSRSTTDCEQDYPTHFYDRVLGPAKKIKTGWYMFTFDSVFSIQCPYWPTEAQEWQTRHRPQGWPSKDLIDQVVSEGCYLVGKSHPSCKEDDKTQWRYSFSKAEVRLISSWTDSQKYVYHVLRLIKSEIFREADCKKTGLCTYHFKTQMLWACEEQPAEFWADGNHLTAIHDLLRQMEQRLTERNFPNYFLRDSNIIEGKFTENGFREITRLLNNGLRSLRFKLPPKVCLKCCISLTLPAEMALYIHLLAERYGVLFQAHGPNLEKVRALVDEALDDLMNGIYTMQLAQTMGNSYYALSEQIFRKATARSESVSSHRPSIKVAKRITITHHASQSAAIVVAVYDSLGDGQLSILGDGRHHWDFSVVTNCTNGQCSYATKSLTFPWSDANGKFNQTWTNPSHLLSVAYLCNLYFKTGRYAMCHDVALKEHRLATGAYYSELFPMIFCPELVTLFDESIQSALGFLWLYRHLSGGGGGNFEFSTCPQLFLLYIDIQSLLRLGDLNSISGAVNRFNMHRQICFFRFHLNVDHHHILLDLAWRTCIRP